MTTNNINDILIDLETVAHALATKGRAVEGSALTPAYEILGEAMDALMAINIKNKRAPQTLDDLSARLASIGLADADIEDDYNGGLTVSVYLTANADGTLTPAGGAE